MMMLRRVLYAPLTTAIKASGVRDLIDEDLRHWMRAEGSSRSRVMASRTWRAQLLYRLRSGRKPSWLLARMWCVPLGFERTLIIDCPDVGGGLYIQHGLATIVAAQKIGSGCRINQQVTVGWSKGGRPTIGDDVEVKAGAKVLGGISVGHRVRIGANAVVLRDVPDGLTVVGVPTHHYGAHRDALKN